MSYYEEQDLDRFAEIGKQRPDLFDKFMAWYQACQADGALTRREKALIGLAVAHSVSALTALTLSRNPVLNLDPIWSK